MALEPSLAKIPIRIIRSKDYLGKVQDEIVMDCSDAISFGSKIRTKIRKFKKIYSKLLADLKKLSKKGKRRQASDYWKIGKLICKNNLIDHLVRGWLYPFYIKVCFLFATVRRTILNYCVLVDLRKIHLFGPRFLLFHQFFVPLVVFL